VDCFAELQLVFDYNIFGGILGVGVLFPASSSRVAAHASEQILKDGLQIFRVDVVVTSASTASETGASKLIENILVFEAAVGVVVCGASLVVHAAFAIVGEDLVGAK
jgi:hypothetical protein